MSYVNRGSVLAIGVTFIITSITAVAARFAVRIHHRTLGIDDWLCFAAMLLVLGECVVMIVGYATHSLGTHTPPHGPELLTMIDPSQQMMKKLEYVVYCLFIPALTLLKLSTLFFYKRLFRGRAFKIAFWLLSILSVLWGVSFLVAWAAGCEDVRDHWISTLTLKTKCTNTFRVLICQAVIDVAVDLALLVLPIPFVFALKMPLKRKMAVSGTLVVGALAIGCGMYRMVIVVQALAVPFLVNPTVAGMRSNDIKGVVTALTMWSMLELGIGMVAVCLPALRLLLHKESRKSMGQSFRSLIRLQTLSDRSSRKTSDSESLSNSPNDHKLDYFNKTGVSTASASFDATTINTVHTEEEHSQKAPEDKIMVQRTVDISRVA